MLLAVSQMDPTVQGIFFLVAVVLLLVSAFLARPNVPWSVAAVGLACAWFVFCWNAFAAS